MADHLDQEKESTPNRANRIQVLDQYIKLIIPYLIISMVFDSLGIKLVTHTLTSLYDMQFIVEFSQMLNFMPMVMQFFISYFVMIYLFVYNDLKK